MIQFNRNIIITIGAVFLIISACGSEKKHPANAERESLLDESEVVTEDNLVDLSDASDIDTPEAAEDDDGDAQSRSVTVGCQSLAITTSHLPDGVYGVAYAGENGRRIEVEGGCGHYSCTVSGLHTGLEYADGAIRGTPTELGSHDIAVSCSATDGSSSAGRELTLDVKDTLAIQLFAGSVSGTEVTRDDALNPATLPAFTDEESTLIVEVVGHAPHYSCISSDGLLTLVRLGPTSFSVDTEALGRSFSEVAITCEDDAQENQTSIELASFLLNQNPCDMTFDIEASSLVINTPDGQGNVAKNGDEAEASFGADGAIIDVNSHVSITFSATGGVPAGFQWRIEHGMTVNQGDGHIPHNLNWEEPEPLVDGSVQFSGFIGYSGADISDEMTENITVYVTDSACGGRQKVKGYKIIPRWNVETADKLKVSLSIADVDDTDEGITRMLILFMRANKIVVWAEYDISQCRTDDQHVQCEQETVVHSNGDCVNEMACDSNYSTKPWEMPVTDIDRIVVYFEDRLDGADDRVDFDIQHAAFYTESWSALFHDDGQIINDNVVMVAAPFFVTTNEGDTIENGEPGEAVYIARGLFLEDEGVFLPHSVEGYNQQDHGIHFRDDIFLQTAGSYHITPSLDGYSEGYPNGIWKRRQFGPIVLPGE